MRSVKNHSTQRMQQAKRFGLVGINKRNPADGDADDHDPSANFRIE
jgi:hypothetical protein